MRRESAWSSIILQAILPAFLEEISGAQGMEAFDLHGVAPREVCWSFHPLAARCNHIY
jgi:hypothetical protein